MALISGNAWAAWDGTSAVYCPTNEQNYDDLNKAYEGIKDLTNDEITLELYKNVNLTARLEWSNTKKLKIVPMANVSVDRPGQYNGFLLKQGGGSISIGSSDHTLTINGKNVTNYQRVLFYVESNTSMTLENIIIKDINFGSGTNGTGYIYKIESSKGGSQSKLYMKNVVVSNCSTTNAGLILNEKTNDDMINLYNTITFENCSGPFISTKGRIRLGESGDKPTITNPISINWQGSTSTDKDYTNVIVKVPTNGLNNFYLTNDNWGLYQTSADVRLTEAYTAETKSEAEGAATLVLPFAATIPNGVKAYKLTKLDENNDIQTEEVSGTLEANTPVLINTTTEGGKYKFVSTATKHNTTTGSGTPISDLLTGVYSETTVEAGNYILASGSSGIGFYKSKGSSKVEANHAYLTIDNSSDSAKPSFFRVIGGGDGGTTLIKGIETNEEKAQEGVYNLNGVRMDKPERKGIYIVNGKKRIVK